MLRRRKKVLLFFFSCVTALLLHKLFPTIHLVVTSQLLLTDGNRQAAANQVPPKPASSRLHPRRRSRRRLPKPLGFFTMNRNLRLYLRIASIFLTLALETVSEAWGKKRLQEKSCVPVPPRGSGGIRQGAARLEATASSGPAWRTTRAHRTHLGPNRDRLPKHLHRGNWQTLHKSAVSPPSSLEGLPWTLDLHSPKGTKFDFLKMETQLIYKRSVSIFTCFRCIFRTCMFHFRYIYIYILFQIVFNYRLLQDAQYSSLCGTEGPCQ